MMTTHLDNVEIIVKFKIKLSHHRPGHAVRIPRN
jgi:hypothetical protein